MYRNWASGPDAGGPRSSWNFRAGCTPTASAAARLYAAPPGGHGSAHRPASPSLGRPPQRPHRIPARSGVYQFIQRRQDRRIVSVTGLRPAPLRRIRPSGSIRPPARPRPAHRVGGRRRRLRHQGDPPWPISGPSPAAAAAPLTDAADPRRRSPAGPERQIKAQQTREKRGTNCGKLVLGMPMLRATSLTPRSTGAVGGRPRDRHDARTRRERDQWRHGLPGTQQRARARKAAAT